MTRPVLFFVVIGCSCSQRSRVGHSMDRTVQSRCFGGDSLAQLRFPAGVAQQEAFLRWLLGFLQGGLYPGAPFGRKYFAAESLSQLVELWSNDGDWTPARGYRREQHSSALIHPIRVSDVCSSAPSLDFAQPGFVSALLGEQIDPVYLVRPLILKLVSRLVVRFVSRKRCFTQSIDCFSVRDQRIM